MSIDLDEGDVDAFRRTISKCLGLRSDRARDGFYGDVLRRRLDETRQSCAGYLHRLETERPRAEFAALADELTVPETYFFRNIDQFTAFSEHVLPERLKQRSGGDEVRVLSAGCASGEEAYTLAILFRELLEPGQTASVLAVDLNPSVLERAKSGRFSAWSLRETPIAMQERWFRHDGRDVVIDDEIRSAVRFEQHNLIEDDSRIFGSEQYDAVFCRNVIMYFTPESCRGVVQRISRSLVPGGFLFLGHAETLRGVTQDFELRHTNQTFYYQRKAEGDRVSVTSPKAASPSADEGPALSVLVDQTDAWVEAIQEASERVKQLVVGAAERGIDPAAVDPTPPAVPAPVGLGLGEALALLREERFDEALHVLEGLPSGASDDPDVLLLRAVLLTHVGLLTLAEEVCTHLLDIDEFNASAHYVLALCREGLGDVAGAVDHDGIAAYLDQNFAMPRLHLGLLARRTGDLPAMRNEFDLAARLLECEDASRLLLFGGGFSRAALIELCSADARGLARS